MADTTTTFSHDPSHGMVDPEIFIQLQSKIDEDTATREHIREILQELEKHGEWASHAPSWVLEKTELTPPKAVDSNPVYPEHTRHHPLNGVRNPAPNNLSLSLRVIDTWTCYVASIISDTKSTLESQKAVVHTLASFASQYSYYKYFQTWNRNIQDVVRYSISFSPPYYLKPHLIPGIICCYK